jgi:beta-lactamase superfamily II metal-dependent hydrolase
MKIEIFNVEHGACALITDNQNKRIMIDCGHNAATGWRPGGYLRSIGVSYLEKLVITNYDEDHVSGLINLMDNVSVGHITRNIGVTPEEIRQLKSEDGMGAGIDRLVFELSHNFRPPGVAGPGAPFPVFAGVTESHFSHSRADFDDENNLSLVVKFTCQGTNVLFTGDMERAGWLKLLQRPQFIAALPNTDIYIASHHGRLSGYCEEMFTHFTPTFVVVSDKSLVHATQETRQLYRKHSRGGIFAGESDRHFVTTRSDGDLLIVPGNQQYHFLKRT